MNKHTPKSQVLNAIMNLIFETTEDGVDNSLVESIARTLDDDVTVHENEKVFVYDYIFSDGSVYSY